MALRYKRRLPLYANWQSVYRGKRNVQELLPALSAYLGHSEIDDTYWYLTATPELMALCSRKTEQFAEGGLQ